MAKKQKINWLIIVAVGGVLAYLLYSMTKKSSEKVEGGNGTGTSFSSLPAGCFPFEEIHESSTTGQSWVSFIKEKKDGTSIRPNGNAVSIGSEITISNTTPALDGTYTVRGKWTDDAGLLGSVRVDTPAGYNFNYNALQGGDPRDMTYFGIGTICIL
tara:strand:- start:1482 stop:1952 length:471 start_codon:yes stop_codon:yes gene_type:complete